MLLNTETCLSYLDPTELPRPWGARPSRCRRPTVLADAVRLALLKRHGGAPLVAKWGVSTRRNTKESKGNPAHSQEQIDQE